ncbi:MAG: hypothetical protein HDR99_06200 [Bacteroides sp.]|nr:hypothetical protein [Bacteroides sp.]
MGVTQPVTPIFPNQPEQKRNPPFSRVYVKYTFELLNFFIGNNIFKSTVSIAEKDKVGIQFRRYSWQETRT